MRQHHTMERCSITHTASCISAMIAWTLKPSLLVNIYVSPEPVVFCIAYRRGIHIIIFMNVIPEKVIFEGTIRRLIKRSRTQMTGAVSGWIEDDCCPNCGLFTDKRKYWMDLTPPVVHNDASVAKVVKSVTEKFCDSTISADLWAEDFANYMETSAQDVCLYWTGCPREWRITQRS